MTPQGTRLDSLELPGLPVLWGTWLLTGNHLEQYEYHFFWKSKALLVNATAIILVTLLFVLLVGSVSPPPATCSVSCGLRASDTCRWPHPSIKTTGTERRQLWFLTQGAQSPDKRGQVGLSFVHVVILEWTGRWKVS